jgi:hypothetical protein
MGLLCLRVGSLAECSLGADDAEAKGATTEELGDGSKGGYEVQTAERSAGLDTRQDAVRNGLDRVGGVA